MLYHIDLHYWHTATVHPIIHPSIYPTTHPWQFFCRDRLLIQTEKCNTRGSLRQQQQQKKRLSEATVIRIGIHTICQRFHECDCQFVQLPMLRANQILKAKWNFFYAQTPWTKPGSLTGVPTALGCTGRAVFFTWHGCLIKQCFYPPAQSHSHIPKTSMMYSNNSHHHCVQKEYTESAWSEINNAPGKV